MVLFGLEPTACDSFYFKSLKSLRFYLSTPEAKRLQKSSLLKPFLKVSAFIGVFGRFRMIGENTSKRIRFQTEAH